MMLCARCGLRTSCMPAADSGSTSIARRCCEWHSRTDGGPSSTMMTAARSRAAQPADILLLDWNAVDDDRLRPDLDPLDLLFARTTARHIREVIVAGRSIVRDGRVTGIEFPAMRTELMDRLRAGLRENAGLARCAAASSSARSRPISKPSRRAASSSFGSIMPIAKVHRISASAPDDVERHRGGDCVGTYRSQRRHRGAGEDRRQWPRQRFLARARDARVELAVPAPSAVRGGGAHLPGHVGRHRRRHGAALGRVRTRQRGDGAAGPVARHRPRPHAGAAVRASRPRWRRSIRSRPACVRRWTTPASPIRQTCISCR